MNLVKLASVAIVVLFASQSNAQTVLTVSNTDESQAEMVVKYSLDELQNLDQTSFETINDYVEAQTQFSGPLLRDLLAPFKISEDATLVMSALNNFQIKIPFSDATDYDVIVALERNGARMSIRENGPLWVIYPLSNHPELETSVYNSRMIWQLVDIKIE